MTTTPDNLTLAVNHALALQGNSSAAVARARAALIGTQGMGLDSKRPQAWCEFGWPETVTREALFGLYRRGGLAHGAVNKVAGTCWHSNPWVIEGDKQDESRPETTWEAQAKRVLNARLWRAFAEADKRRLVSKYAGLLLHIKDGKTWDQPVTAGRGLARVTVAWAASLKPDELVTDTASERYGEPKKWTYKEASQNGSVGRVVDVHPDRVFILGDWRDDAIGFLEPAFNAFVSVEKVEGGAGESFLKNAARQLNINFDKEIDFSNLAAMYGVSVADLQERFNEVAKEVNRGNDVLLPTQGATVTPLVSAVPDPSPTYGINLQTISAALDIPSRILVGNQQGERASTEDLKEFRSRCQSRRQDLSFEIEDFVDHLARLKVLELSGEKTVMWSDLNEQTSSERLDSAEKMSRINQTAIATGEAVFDGSEIRVAAGFEPRDGPLDEGGDDDEEAEVGDPAE